MAGVTKVSQWPTVLLRDTSGRQHLSCFNFKILFLLCALFARKHPGSNLTTRATAHVHEYGVGVL
jgi:hypothetical protein